MHGGFMDNTEVNISQEIPAYERRYRKISEWFLNCKPAYAILKQIYGLYNSICIHSSYNNEFSWDFLF